MFRKLGLLFAAMVLSMSMIAGLAGSAGANPPVGTPGLTPGVIELDPVFLYSYTEEGTDTRDCQVNNENAARPVMGSQTVQTETEIFVYQEQFQNVLYAGSSNVILEYGETYLGEEFEVEGETVVVSEGPCNAGRN
jgi:hypothetical protein